MGKAIAVGDLSWSPKLMIVEMISINYRIQLTGMIKKNTNIKTAPVMLD